MTENVEPPLLPPSDWVSSVEIGKRYQSFALLITRLRLFFFVLLAIVAILADFFVPNLLWQNSRKYEFIAFICLGALIGEVALLAIWAGVGPHSLVLRFFCGLGGTFLVSLAYLLGLVFAVWMNDNAGIPVEAILFILAVGHAGFLAATALFLVLNLVTGFRIRSVFQEKMNLVESKQIYSTYVHYSS